MTLQYNDIEFVARKTDLRSSCRSGVVLALGLAFLGLAGFSGCSRVAPLPSTNEAKAVLQTALDAWVAGKTPADMKGATPPIHIVDGQWLQGSRLESFAIKESPNLDGNSWRFEVTLNTVEKNRKKHRINTTYNVYSQHGFTIARADE